MMDGSKDILERILQNNPSLETLLAVLDKLKREGRWNDIVRIGGRFSESWKDDIRLKILLAEAYRKVGFLGLAEKELAGSVAIIEHLIPVYKRLAQIYEEQGRYEEAAGNIKKYLACFPDDPEALNLSDRILSSLHRSPLEEGGDAFFDDLATPTIAEIYFDQGQLEAAVSVYEKVLAGDSRNEKVRSRLQELKALADSEKNRIRQEKNTLHTTEKMIEILERWLPEIRGIAHAGAH